MKPKICSMLINLNENGYFSVRHLEIVQRIATQNKMETSVVDLLFHPNNEYVQEHKYKLIGGNAVITSNHCQNDHSV